MCGLFSVNDKYTPSEQDLPLTILIQGYKKEISTSLSRIYQHDPTTMAPATSNSPTTHAAPTANEKPSTHRHGPNTSTIGATRRATETTFHEATSREQSQSSSGTVDAAAVRSVMGPPPPKDEKTSWWKRWRSDLRESRELGAPMLESSRRWKVGSVV